VARVPRKPKPLTRKVGTVQPKRTLIVYCEGTKTEPQYLEMLKREPDIRARNSVELRIMPLPSGRVPLTLVQMAVEAKRKSKEVDGEVDEFWCVFDVEAPQPHPHLAEAMTAAQGLMAKRNDASRRALSVERRHEKNGTDFPNDNPSSGMYRLLESLQRPETTS
jgi:hypothetical protein